jgi:hypothetical protein
MLMPKDLDWETENKLKNDLHLERRLAGKEAPLPHPSETYLDYWLRLEQFD